MYDWQDQAKFFYDRLNCQSVVITRGGGGVVGITDGQLWEFKPESQVKVESVVGAGDCFCAFLAMATAHGFKAKEAAEIAWKAGAIYVQNSMNRPIVPAELCEDKIVHPADLSSRDFKLVFTNGCFDILHEGHIESLKFAKSKGEKLVVALNSDESIKRLKGPDRPVKNLRQRMAVMAAIRYVDFVTYFEEDTPLEVIKTIVPDVLVKGSQYTGPIVGEDIVSEVYRAPMVDGVSTTILLGR